VSIEKRDTRSKDFAPTVQVAQRPANEEQRREEKRIRFHNPLNASQVGMKVLLQGGQRDVHGGSVNKCHARTEDGRGQNPSTLPGRAELTQPRENRGFVARRFHDRHNPLSGVQ
jgi:hypothetical protein